MTRRLLAALVLAAACQGAVEPSSRDHEALPDAGAMDDAGDAAPPVHEDAGTPDAGPEVDPHRVCSPDGWCYEEPYPAAEDLRGAAHFSPELTVLVGRRGRILHLAPAGVRGEESGTTHDLFAVQAFGREAWAVGAANTFLHFDGTEWSQHEVDAALPADDLHALWGATADDIWAFGSLGALWHYDGTSWSKQTSPTSRPLHAAWGASASRIYAVGEGPTLLSYDGERWVASNLPGGSEALAIHGTSENDIWAAGTNGRMWHFDGSTWTDLMTPVGTSHVRALLAVSPTEVYVAGDGGTAFRYDGAAWQQLTTGTTEPLHALHRESERLLTAGGHGTLIAFDGAERTTYSHGARDNYLDLSAGGASAPWVVGDQVLRLGEDGPSPVVLDSVRSLFGCYALDDELAWAVGTGGTIVRWDGATMTPSDSGTDRWLRAVWAASPASAWVVGEQGTVLGLFNGTTWVPSAAGTNADLFDVWGASADDVWIAGDAGTLLHWNGSEWSQQDAATTVRLHAVWGRSADDVWMVGASGTILHWDGQALEVAQQGDSYALYGVWGDDDATYAVGSGGTVLRRAADAWELEQTPTDVTLFGVGRGADGALRAVGADGVILVKP